jgi:hypothetical protein
LPIAESAEHLRLGSAGWSREFLDLVKKRAGLSIEIIDAESAQTQKISAENIFRGAFQIQLQY